MNITKRYSSAYIITQNNLKTMTPKQIMVDGANGFDSIYDRAVKMFKEWKKQYEL